MRAVAVALLLGVLGVALAGDGPTVAEIKAMSEEELKSMQDFPKTAAVLNGLSGKEIQFMPMAAIINSLPADEVEKVEKSTLEAVANEDVLGVDADKLTKLPSDVYTDRGTTFLAKLNEAQVDSMKETGALKELMENTPRSELGGLPTNIVRKADVSEMVKGWSPEEMDEIDSDFFDKVSLAEMSNLAETDMETFNMIKRYMGPRAQKWMDADKLKELPGIKNGLDSMQGLMDKGDGIPGLDKGLDSLTDMTDPSALLNKMMPGDMPNVANFANSEGAMGAMDKFVPYLPGTGAAPAMPELPSPVMPKMPAPAMPEMPKLNLPFKSRKARRRRILKLKARLAKLRRLAKLKRILKKHKKL